MNVAVQQLPCTLSVCSIRVDKFDTGSVLARLYINLHQVHIAFGQSYPEKRDDLRCKAVQWGKNLFCDGMFRI